jgi:predicted AlkP superfamily phosphohydrolase/phosphomutase
MTSATATTKPLTLFASLRLSLTFWLIVGGVVWLTICVQNDLFAPFSDVLKVFVASLLLYGAIGCILWIPIWLLEKASVACKIFGTAGFRIQFSLQVLFLVVLTFFFPLHKIWLPDTPARSMQGLLFSVLLLAGGILVGIILALVLSPLRRFTMFRTHLRAGIVGFILIILIYSGFLLAAEFHESRAQQVPPELNSALPTGAKVFLIGFDAATWDAIDPLLAAGKLPHFAALIENGTRTPLKSDKPTLSAILWTTIVTGKNARGHGARDIVSIIAPGLEQNVLRYPYFAGCYPITEYFTRIGFFKMVPLSSTARKTKAIWNILTDYNRRVGVVGWWGSYPPETVNGVIISDHTSMVKNEMREGKGQLSRTEEMPADFARSPTYPPAILKELSSAEEQSRAMSLEELNYFIRADSSEWEKVNRLENWDREHLESAIKVCYLTDKFFRLATEHLLDAEDFDLVLSYFFESDGIAHWMWPYRVADLFPRLPAADVQKYRGTVDSTYINLDRMLGSLLEHASGKYHIIVMSDHGFGVEPGGSVGHEHAPDGILILAGPYFKKDAVFAEKPGLEDITPTILTLLGIPVGEDMSGRILIEAFQPDFLRRFPPRSIESHDRGHRFRPKATLSEEDQSLRDKLRALGYIE